jgi:hypothetical protein
MRRFAPKVTWKEMDLLFRYDPNKVCLMWLRIIELFRFVPNLEVFK